MLPGFRTELTGLSHDEALALLATGAAREHVLGLGPALASAMRKVVDALPETDQLAVSSAAQRVLLNPRTDLLSRPGPLATGGARSLPQGTPDRRAPAKPDGEVRSHQPACEYRIRCPLWRVGEEKKGPLSLLAENRRRWWLD